MKLIASSIGQATREGCSFVLIHIVESPSAIIHGKGTADFETEKKIGSDGKFCRRTKTKGL